jgi:hypothetical protein
VRVQALHPDADLPRVRIFEANRRAACLYLARLKPGFAIKLVEAELYACLDAGHPPLDLLMPHCHTDLMITGENRSSTPGKRVSRHPLKSPAGFKQRPACDLRVVGD